MPPSRDVESWSLPVAEMQVSQVRFDFGFGLCASEIGPDDDRRVRSMNLSVQCPFSLIDKNGLRQDFDPQDPWSSMASLLDLRHTVVTDAVVDEVSNIELAFSNGSKVILRPTGLRGWTLHGPDGLLLHGNAGYDPRRLPSDYPTSNEVSTTSSPSFTSADVTEVSEDLGKDPDLP